MTQHPESRVSRMTSSPRRVLMLCVVTAAITIFFLYLLKSYSHTPAEIFLTVTSFCARLHINTSENIPLYFTPALDETPTEDCPCLGDPEGAKEVKDVAMEIGTQEDALLCFFQSHKFKVEEGLGVRREALDPEFEVPLFRFPAVRQAGCLPDHHRSKVMLLTPRDRLTVGGSVQFRIDVHNACGQPRSSGGDVIRAWLHSRDRNSSVAAKVKYLQNGSYIGETVLPWPEVTLVRVSLTYSQEFMRLSVELYHSVHSMSWTVETLQGEGVTEKVPCLPFTPIPGYAKSCNFTAANGGRPWFCGHPVTKGVNCSHRTIYENLPHTLPLPVPAALQLYMDRLTNCCFNKDLRLIPNDIHLALTRGPAPFPPPLPPCSSLPRKDTWDSPSSSPSPRGWFRHGLWVPSACSLPPFNTERVRRCMKNRTLLLLGDSNQRILWGHIMGITGCDNLTMPHWHAPHICKNSTLRSTVIFAIHAFPFMPGHHGGQHIANLPLPVALDTAQRLGYPGHELTVVLHFYSHLATHSVQVYRSFVHGTREIVRKYLKLHPKTEVVIRGPHVMHCGGYVHVHEGDKFGEWYQRIWRQEFAELADRVWYMDTWDMTIASENFDMHIPDSVVREMLNMLFGYIC